MRPFQFNTKITIHANRKYSEPAVLSVLDSDETLMHSLRRGRGDNHASGLGNGLPPAEKINVDLLYITLDCV